MDGDVWPLMIALMAGIALGGWHFGGLWWTVQRLPMASSPVCLALASFWIRLAGCLLGFYVVMDGRWERLVVCVLGFLSMRVLLVRRWRPAQHPLSAAPPRGRRV